MRHAISREALIVVAFSGAQLVLGLAGTRLLTQVAAPDALGEYYLFMNLVLWLTLPASSSYLYVWKTWTVARATGHASRFSRAIVTGLGWQALVCAAGCAVLVASGVLRTSILVLLAIALAAFGQAVNQTLDQVQTLERRRVLAGVLGLLANPFRSGALALGALMVLRQSGATLISTQCIYGICTAAFSAWLFRRTLQSPYRGERAGEDVAATTDLGAQRFLRFSLPLLLTSIATQAATSAERWGLALRAAPGATAMFVQAVGVSLAAVTAVTLPINTYFTPLISQAAASSPHDPLRAASRPLRQFVALSAVAVAMAALAIGVLAGSVSGILFGPRYQDIAVLLPWAMLGQALFGLSQAVAMVPITANATVGVSGAIIGSKALYLVLLLAIPSSADAALVFVKCFALGNLVYFIGISTVATRIMRARPEKRTADGTSER